MLLLLCNLPITPSLAQVRLPDETAGLDNIVKVLISTFDQVDVLALADAHQRKINSELRLAVVRDPEFARKARFIVVEFANTMDQPILDRYVNGDTVPPDQLRQVWRNTCCGDTWNSSVYAEFFAAVRDVNKNLPSDRRIRVLGGDPPAGTPATQRDLSVASVLRTEVLGKGKALVIYGGGHLGYGGEIAGVVRAIRPENMFVVEAHGGTDPDYKQFDLALKSPERPVLFSVKRAPFADFRADFLGRGTKALMNGVWLDMNPTAGRTLGQASSTDAFVYFGSGPGAETSIEPPR